MHNVTFYYQQRNVFKTKEDMTCVNSDNINDLESKYNVCWRVTLRVSWHSWAVSFSVAGAAL